MRKGQGRGKTRRGFWKVRSLSCPHTHQLWLGEEGQVPGLGDGDINHRGAPVRVASGTKGKHSSKGQDFSPWALGAWRPTTATPGGQGWEEGIWGSGLGFRKGPCHGHLDHRGEKEHGEERGSGRFPCPTGAWQESQVKFLPSPRPHT